MPGMISQQTDQLSVLLAWNMFCPLWSYSNSQKVRSHLCTYCAYRKLLASIKKDKNL